jgi:alkylated DNA repair protein (DNA oxidative demethylase)
MGTRSRYSWYCSPKCAIKSRSSTIARTRPWTDVELRSGDLFVFGGPTRLAYHGVVRTVADTAPRELGLNGTRISVTLRDSGR